MKYTDITEDQKERRRLCDRLRYPMKYKRNRKSILKKCKRYRKENSVKIRVYNKRYSKDHPEINCISATRYRLKKYGITPEDYDAMYVRQEGKCAICRQPETNKLKGSTARLSVDHNHQTGKIRGLLCNLCNTGLGKFKDSCKLLKAAALYVRRDNEVFSISGT